MTASYVAVTAAAVLAAEVVIIATVALSAGSPMSRQDLEARARSGAYGLASKLSATVATTGRLTGTDPGTQGIPLSPGLARPDSYGGVLIPQTSTPWCELAPASFAVVVSPSGTVLATSYPACFPLGSQGAKAEDGAPAKVLRSFPARTGGGGSSSLPSGTVVWAAAPITIRPGTATGKPPGPGASPIPSVSADGKIVGDIYLEVPAVAEGSHGFGVSSSLIRVGLLVLGLCVPVGILFGLLSTRRLTRRLKRLAASTLEVADGAFERRIPVTGADEVSQLEENFNRMAKHLQASVDAERQLAVASARHQERSRIARELHDSISQDLFSLSMLAGGLRRALPPGSAVLPEVETMERTAGDTMREMQALLLELRPIALGDVGLVTALSEICRAYRDRLGIEVRAELEPLVVPAALEHAMLRVTQEALANAVKHAGAGVITIRLLADADQIILAVADDGRGFDADGDGSGGGLGLRAMRDRAAEQGGTLRVDSVPGEGSTVTATFPRRLP